MAKIQQSVFLLTTLQRRVVFPYSHRQNPLVTFSCARSVPWAKCHLSWKALPTLAVTFLCDTLTGAVLSADKPTDWCWWSGLQTLWWCPGWGRLRATATTRTVKLFLGYLSSESCFNLQKYLFQLTAPVYISIKKHSNMFRLIHAAIIRKYKQGSNLVKNI